MTAVINPSLFKTPYPEQVAGTIEAALSSVDPYRAVAEQLDIHGEWLKVGRIKYHLTDFKKVFLLSVGKASIPMTRATYDKLGTVIDVGLIIYKSFSDHKELSFPSTFQLIKGDHPIPGIGSIQAGNAVINMMQDITKDDLLMVLISGGGSALMTAPVVDIPLSSIQDLTRKLLASGATIQEINVIRKHLDRIKGGGLIKMTSGVKVLSLMISDVVGDDLSTIASGPTTFDETTFLDAFAIIEKYHLQDSIDPTIYVYLQQGGNDPTSETIKPGDERLVRVQNQIILRNLDAIKAAKDYALKQGWKMMPDESAFTGEARMVGTQMGEKLKEFASRKSKSSQTLLFIAGGETTVTLKGRGRGGRNLELALAAVCILDGKENVAMVSLATDGEDGITDAAGAIVTGKTASIARSKGLDPINYLANNDSYTFFEQTDGLLKTGPSDTNVNDLIFLFAF